ncbi:hypothetical protein IscW_ISCW001217, partial [Ixodes scapularis]
RQTVPNPYTPRRRTFTLFTPEPSKQPLPRSREAPLLDALKISAPSPHSPSPK